MGYKETYKDWLSWADDETKKELSALHDEKEIEDRFYRYLEFGTAGLRGIMGAGTNRMNRYTVARATKGLSEYLKALYPGELSRGLVIAYDSRNHSREFAVEAAAVLTASGIPVKIFKELEPIPVLSFSVLHFHALGGIVITASHNPPEYNGYKVYGEDGGQLVPKKADVLTEYVEKVKDLSAIDHRTREDLITWLGEDVVDLFIDTIVKESRYHGNPPPLKVVYTPIHGSGLMPVMFTLKEKGYTVRIVAEQEAPDGNFPTVKKPNPEERDALVMGIRQAKETGADLVLGTDPDCDRVGIAVRNDGGYQLLNGNQIGALLVNYLLTRRKDRLKKNSVILKSIVTNDFGAAVAKSYGVETVETLTGFKYIGEAITAYEETGEHDFMMGYEESYGFLIGRHVRDKDAVVTSLLICEMAAYYKEKGYSLYDILKSLHHRFGYYLDAVDSVTYAGSAGKARMKEIMASLREKEHLFGDTPVMVLDYLDGCNGLPPADVLKYVFEDGSWAAVRPSGTEPKLKIYYSVKGKNERAASARLMAFSDILLEATE